jgi:aspartate/methionine/tyrosine aminotransferase
MPWIHALEPELVPGLNWSYKMKPLSSRIKNIHFGSGSPLLKRSDNTIYMGAGTIDFETFEHVHQAAIEAIRADLTAYTDNQGMPELRQAIAEKLQRENDVTHSADEILVTSGSSEALGVIPQVVMEPGDEAIMFDPHYLGAFTAIVELAGGKPIVLPTHGENNWQPDPEMVEKAITPRTKLLILCSPSNPVGSLLHRETVEAFCELAIKHDLYVLSDELYERIVFEGKRVVSPASLPGMRERTFTVNGFSKAYGMTGWRVGYVACDRPLLQAVHRAQVYVGICAPSISQHAALAALTGPQEPHARMLAELDRRRRFLAESLATIDGFDCRPQEATFYNFIDIRPFMQNKGDAVRSVLSSLVDYKLPQSISRQFTDFMLAQGNVYLSAGGDFGEAGDGWVRISGADRMEKLEQGVRAIQEAAASV